MQSTAINGLNKLLLSMVLFYAFSVQGVQADSFHFAAIGDTPYSDQERQSLPFIFQDAKQRNSEFMLHIGDIWSGHTSCEEGLYLDRKALFQQSLIPFVIVPGDNEYTDCRNINAQQALDYFRQYLVGDHNLDVGELNITHQHNRVENVTWKYQGLRFIGINLPGDVNIAGVKDDLSKDNYAFIEGILSKENDMQGLVLFSQANPMLYQTFYNTVYDLLTSLSLAEMPVLIIHGDTHSYTFKLFNKKPNWWRLEVSKQPFEWAEISFNPDSFYPFSVSNRTASELKK